MIHMFGDEMGCRTGPIDIQITSLGALFVADESSNPGPFCFAAAAPLD